LPSYAPLAHVEYIWSVKIVPYALHQSPKLLAGYRVALLTQDLVSWTEMRLYLS